MPNKKDSYSFDVVVIGGGASGMMAALAAAQKNARVAIIEKNDELGKKISVTGKGRCNITQENLTFENLIEAFGKKGRFLMSSFKNFDIPKTKDFFEKIGIKLKTERGGRVFPKSDQAQEVIEKFKNHLTKNGVVFLRKTKIKSFEIKNHKIEKIITNKKEIVAKQFVLCTGGKSYPTTGSTGDGYQWAKSFGHTIVQPKPALTPVKVINKWSYDLQGVSLKNVNLSVFQNDKKQAEIFGEMLFTHYGISGPIVLEISKKVGELLKKDRVKILIDLKPALDFKELDQRILKDFDKYRAKKFSNALDDLLPQKMIPVIIKISKINPDKKVAEISKEERLELVKILKELTLNVDGLVGFDNAIITSGGVSLGEIDQKTMQSKIIDNLFFAGEIIDLDGPTGGYNLQLCWTTGHTAGINAALKTKNFK